MRYLIEIQRLQSHCTLRTPDALLPQEDRGTLAPAVHDPRIATLDDVRAVLRSQEEG